MFRVSVCSEKSRRLIYLWYKGALEIVGTILHRHVLIILHVEIVGGVSLVVCTDSTSSTTINAHFHQLSLHLG